MIIRMILACFLASSLPCCTTTHVKPPPHIVFRMVGCIKHEDYHGGGVGDYRQSAPNKADMEMKDFFQKEPLGPETKFASGCSKKKT